VIVLDTSVVSLALRRRKLEVRAPAVRMLRELIDEEADLGVPGIVIQELLSGVRTDRAFEKLRLELEQFDVLLATQDEHVLAARVINGLLNVGVAVKSVDALIAAQTITHNAQLFTLDQDFERIASHVGLSLLKIEN
jgi:predicted nucleic acid-binding protein